MHVPRAIYVQVSISQMHVHHAQVSISQMHVPRAIYLHRGAICNLAHVTDTLYTKWMVLIQQPQNVYVF
ncbi:hypothetical protein HanRHA438_Chr09g0380941 [Helianthus annuus]|nr:hypothetical protein HanRHA438_Chr09g0380941 [Helianthus annuus]